MSLHEIPIRKPKGGFNKVVPQTDVEYERNQLSADPRPESCTDNERGRVKQAAKRSNVSDSMHVFEYPA